MKVIVFLMTALTALSSFAAEKPACWDEAQHYAAEATPINIIPYGDDTGVIVSEPVIIGMSETLTEYEINTEIAKNYFTVRIALINEGCEIIALYVDEKL